MAALTVANYLGLLQEDPDNDEAIEGLRAALSNGHTGGDNPVRLLEMARMQHEQRGDLRAAASLIELEAPLITDDPALEAALFKELGRIRHEELLDDEGAKGAFQRALELRPDDEEIQAAIEQVDLAATNWKDIARRFIEEADDASDATLKTSLLTRAAALIWQYKKRGRDKEVDKLFQQALEADPASTRTARLYAETLRARDRWDELAEVLLSAAEHARNRDEKLNYYLRAGRVFVRRLGQKERAAQCYERVLDFSPGQEEALRFLVEHFTEREEWEHLVALYEDALRSRQKLESEQGILLQIGMVHWRIRSSPAEAEPYFNRLRKIDPAHPGMISFYREFLQKDDPRLLTILGDGQRVAKDSPQKLALAVEVARAAQGNDATTERAIDAWKAVQRLDPSNTEAQKALRELYRKGEKWNALVELLKGEVEALGADEVDRKVRLYREMIAIYRERLSLDVMVINTYNAILQLLPNDEEALAALAATYESMGRWNDLIQVLARRAEHEPDPAKKVDLHLRVAELWIDRFANYNQATRPLEEVISIEPGNRQALSQLKQIYEKRRAWGPLFDVLRKEADLASDPEARVANKVELAKIAGERLHRNADAIALWKEVVELAPRTEGALDSLERLAEREKDWVTLAEVLEKRVAVESDPSGRVRLLTRLGALFGEHLEDPARAARAWKGVLELDPKNGRALRTLRESFLKAGDWDGLEGLYAESADWEGLVEVLGQAAERAPTPDLKKDLSFRAAEIYEKRIGEPHRAFRNYERVLSIEPRNVRAAKALVPIYERDENFARLSSMKEILLESLGERGEPADRLALIDELRGLSRRLADAKGAFAWASRAYAIAPGDAAVVKSLEDAAEAAGEHEGLARLYRERVSSAQGDEALRLRRRLAGLAGERLGRPEDAIAQLEQILASDPSDAESIEVLDRLYRAAGRTADLRRLYAHRIEHARDAAAKVRMLRELAALDEDQLDDARAAVAHYEMLLTIEPDDAQALTALDRLYADHDRPRDHVDILRRLRELSTDDASRVELALRLAEKLVPLEDARGALDAYADALRVAPGNDRAVAGLEGLVRSAPELASEADRLLESAYESKRSYEKLSSVLEKRLEVTVDDDERRALRLRLAELAGTELGDVAGAYTAIEAAFLDRPSDTDLWDRLAAAADRAGKHQALAAAFARAIEVGKGLSKSDVAELAARAATIHEEVLGDSKAAEPFHRRVLSDDPLSGPAFEALKQLYTDTERWDDLQVLYRNRIAHTVDAEQKLELLLQVCFLFEELLDDADLAIRAYQDVIELDPTNVASRRALDRLYRRTERWRDLVALLRQELDDATGQDRLDSMFELAELHEKRLGEPALAVDYYESVLEATPTHLRSQEALERLLDQPAQRQRIATMLEPLYEQQGAYGELARVLEVQLEDVADPGSRVGLLLRIAELAEVKAHDSDRAFDALSRAVAIDAADTRAREELARLAQLRGTERARAEVLEKALSASTSVSLQSDLLLELARLYDESLHDPSMAERAYARLIEVEGDSPDIVLPAARALERIHLAAGEHGKLAEDLRRQIRFEGDPDARRTLLVRLADLLEDVLGDTDGAIAAHRERLDADASDVDAMRALERLYERKEQWQRLIGVLQARESATVDESEQRTLARRIGAIYEEKLDDADSAIVAYNDAIGRFGPDRETLGALARLYDRTERWDDLLDVLQQDHDLVEDVLERSRLRFRCAELMRTRTGDVDRAIEAYSEVLAVEPDHQGALTALDSIVREGSGDARLAAARVLAPRFEGGGDYERLLGALSVLAESDDPAERLRSLRRAAEVADIGVSSPRRAFELAGRAVKAGLAEPDLRAMLGDLARHAMAADAHREHVDLLRDIVPDVFDAELQNEIMLSIAETAAERMGDVDLARVFYRKVLEERPDHEAALDALESLQVRAGDHAGLLDVLRRKTDLARDDDTRVRLLLRRAEICEGDVDDVAQAIDAYEQVLDVDVRPAAFDGLERLYRRASRWDDLSALLERRLDALSRGAPGNAVEIRHRLGKVMEENLGDTLRAIEHYRETLAQSPSHEPTIAALERLMATDEHRGVAAEILEPVFLQKMDWPRVTAALEARLSAESGLDERKAYLARLGQIHEDYLEDLDGALEVYARLFQEDPADEEVWDTLTRLARNLDKHARLAEIYGAALADISVDEPATAKLSFIAGRIHDEKTGDLAAAAGYYRRALAFDPSDRMVFDALEAVYQRRNEPQSLQDLYRERTEVAESDAERVALLHRMAKLRERDLGDAPGAAEVHREVLGIDPRDSESIDALDRLLTAGERFPDLADHLRHRIDVAAGTDAEVELRYRLAETLGARLGDRAGALDVLEDNTRLSPGHGPTIAKLEEMVLDDDDRLRITRILEPIYRASDEWRKLVAILEAQVALADHPTDRAQLLGEVARLHEERGRDAGRAFEAWARALGEEPNDEGIRGELDRLAGLVGAWDALVAAYENALTKTDDAAVATAMLTTLARVHDEKRGDPRSAIETYERLLHHEPDDGSPLDALEALHTMVGDWRGLVDVLGRKVERSYDAAERGELQRRAGSVLEELLGDRDGAIAAYRRAVDENDSDDIALEALDRLYVQAGESVKLADVVRRRLELDPTAEGRVELAMRLGALLDTQLGRPDDAIDAYRRVLDDDPEHRDAIDGLARLYERQALWPELLDNLRLRAGMTTSSDERVALTHRAGEVLERELDDVHEALGTYEQVLALDGGYEPTIEALLRISRLEDYRERATEIVEPRLESVGRWDELAKLYEQKVEGTGDPVERRAHLRKLATIHERGRGDAQAAFEALSRALSEDPSDVETTDELERVGASMGDWARVADVISSRASNAADPNAARSLFVRLARVAEEDLRDPKRAIDAYVHAIEQVGDDPDLLAALDRLYSSTGRHTELADVLDRRISAVTEPAERNELLFRLGRIREQRQGDLRGAFEAYRDVLDRDPSHADALAALEGLAAHEELALDVVEVLDGVYRQTGINERVAGLYDVRVRLADSDDERVRLLSELAGILENDLGKVAEALAAVRRAFELAPDDEPLLAEVERLAERSSAWETVRGMVEAVSDSSRLDRRTLLGLQLRAASWYRDRLSDVRAAEERLRTAIELDGEAAEAHEQLVELLRAGGREKELLVALRAWANVDPDDLAKRDRLKESARLAESALGDARAAADCYEAVLNSDSNDVDALAELARLRRAENRWDEVVDLLTRRVDVEVDPRTRLDLRRELASILLGPLARPADAIEAYQGILDEDPGDVESVQALERLYEGQERWKDLEELLSRRLDLARTDDDQVAVRVALARLVEQRFGRRDDAIEQLRAILEVQPGNASAQSELERLLEVDERWEELVGLLERQAADAAVSGQMATEIALLDRLARLQAERLSDIEAAIACLERIVERDSTHAAALEQLAALHDQLGDHAAVARDLERLLAAAPGDAAIPTAYRLADLAETKLGDPARAEGALRAAFELDPSRVESRDRLKRHLEAHSRFGELAELLLDEAEQVTVESTKVQALKRVAKLYEEKLGDPGKAAEVLERASQITPEDRDVLLPLCDLYIAAGRSEAAIPVLRKIIDSYGTRRVKEVAQFHHRLGKALEANGDLAAALDAYDAAFKIDLTNVAVLRDLGKLCHAKGDFDRAQKTFRALLLQKLDPSSGITKADVYYYLGDITAKQGDKAKAKSMLQRALAEDKKHAAAQALLASL